MTNAFLTFYTFRIVNLVVCAAFFIRDTDRTIFAYTLTCPASETHLVFCDLAIYFAFASARSFARIPAISSIMIFIDVLPAFPCIRKMLL